MKEGLIGVERAECFNLHVYRDKVEVNRGDRNGCQLFSMPAFLRDMGSEKSAWV